MIAISDDNVINIFFYQSNKFKIYKTLVTDLDSVLDLEIINLSEDKQDNIYIIASNNQTVKKIFSNFS